MNSIRRAAISVIWDFPFPPACLHRMGRMIVRAGMFATYAKQAKGLKAQRCFCWLETLQDSKYLKEEVA